MTDSPQPAPSQFLRIEAAPEHAGLRLDQFLARVLPGHSRARLQQWIAHGRVTTLSGSSLHAAAGRIHAGEVFLIQPEPSPASPASGLKPIAMPLDIVYQDEDLAVINKPSGLLGHPGAGRRDGPTLVHGLLHHFGSSQSLLPGAEAQRPGIIHRLDRLASGLMVVARNEAAHRQLASAFAQREVEKTYLALVHGCPRPDHGVLDQPIARDRVRRTRMTTRNPQGRAARSEYRVVESWPVPALPGGGFSLLEVRILTGRTHQIRVHLAALGHPIAGDRAYGAPTVLVPASATRSRQEAAVPKPLAEWRGRKLERIFLHAARLAFTHPRRGDRVEFTSPLPAELEPFLRQLRLLRENS